MTDERFYLQRMGAEHGPYTVNDLQVMARSGELKSNSLLKREGGNVFLASELPGVFSRREWIVALSTRAFIFAMIRAGRPAAAWAASRAISLLIRRWRL